MTDTTNADSSKPDSDASSSEQDDGSLTFWQVLGSTLAAAFGVQSSKNRKRDFSKGKPSQFIFMGIGFTVVFVLIMIGVVSLVLP
ncbi:MAG: DUF2970 domain-containing protein [Pseudomonadaceae bacterium]|nr:DUF2970 domain-containing protein [Pseudomonadaceae bacterium]